MPASPSTESTRSASPAFTTPLSVTRRGRCIPRRRTSSGSRFSAPAPITIRVGQESTAIRFEAGRSKKDGSVMSGELEVALQLPGGHGPLVLPDLPGAGAEVVVHEFLAEQLAGDGAPVEEGDGVAQVAREGRRGLGPVGVAGDGV